MKKLVAAFACCAVIAMISTAATATTSSEDEEAAAFIRSLGDQVVVILENRDLSHEARVNRFYELFRTAFDENQISGFALGKYRHRIEKAKFDEYRELFGKYMTGLYATKFADYSGEDFVITGSTKGNDGQSDVLAEIRRGDRKPIRLKFRTSKHDGQRKIDDVVIEGVSLLFTKRQEVTAVIDRNGMDTLLERLREAVQLAELQ